MFKNKYGLTILFSCTPLYNKLWFIINHNICMFQTVAIVSAGTSGVDWLRMNPLKSLPSPYKTAVYNFKLTKFCFAFFLGIGLRHCSIFQYFIKFSVIIALTRLESPYMHGGICNDRYIIHIQIYFLLSGHLLVQSDITSLIIVYMKTRFSWVEFNQSETKCENRSYIW